MIKAKYNVLYVDDDDINLRAFEANFRRDFKIFKAISAKEGLKVLKKEDIQVVVSDQRMPETTGLEFLKKVKSEHPYIKLIILTGYTDHEVLKEAINSSVLWWYLNKPYDHENLRSVIFKAIEAYQLEMDKIVLNKELSFRRDWLGNMMNTALDGIITIDENHNIVDINKAACNMFEYKFDELKGKPVNILIPEAKRAIHSEHIRSFSNEESITTKKPSTHVDMLGVTSTGKEINLESSVSKQKVIGGYYYHAFLRDVSARFKAEKERREFESRLKEAQRITHIGHWNNNIITDKHYWSDELYRILEMAPGEIEASAEGFAKNVHPDDKDGFREMYYKALELKQPFDIDYRLQFKDASIKYVHHIVEFALDDNDNVTNSFGTVQDITLQRISEINLKNSEEKFKKFTESLKISVLVIQDRKVKYANNECEALLESSKNEILEKDFSTQVYPDDIDFLNENYKNRMNGKSVDSEYEARIISKSGKIKTVHVTAVKIDYQDNPAVLITLLDITNKKNTEKRLAENATLLQEAQRLAHIGHWTLDIIKDKRYWSDELYRILGMDPKNTDESLEEFYNIVHPDDKGLVRKAYANALELKKSFSINYRLQFEDASIKYINELVELALDTNGDVAKFFGTAQDITSKVLTEQKLRASKERFTLAMKGANDGLWDWDVETNKVYFSPRWKGMLGYADSEIENKFESWINLLHPDDLKPALQYVDDFMNEIVRKFETEFRMKHKDGNYLNILSRAFGIRSESGEVIRVVGTHTDITERKNVEKDIIESNLRFNQLANNTPNVYWLGDASDINNIKWLYINPAFEKVWQHTPEELYQDPSIWYNCIHDEDKERTGTTFMNFLHEKIKNYNVRFRIVRPDGTVRHIAATGNLIKDHNGKITSVAGISRDVTEQVKNEEKIKGLNKNLEKLVKKRTEELSQEKNFSETILNSLPGVFTLMKMDGTQVKWNKNLEHVTGYLDTEFKQMNAFDFFLMDAKKEIMNKMSQLKEEGEINIETNLITKKGIKIPYFLSGVKIEINNKEYIAGSGIDISERKYLETQLKKSKEHVEALYHVSKELSSTLSLKGVLDRVLSELKNVLSFDSASVQVLKGNHYEIISVIGFSQPEKVLNQRFSVEMDTFDKIEKDRKKPVIIKDVRSYHRFKDLSNHKNIRSAMGIPLIIDNNYIGRITFDKNEVDYFNLEHIEQVTAFAFECGYCR